MPLVKIDDYYPEYRENNDMDDIKNFDVYTDGDDKVGSVFDILVDEDTGRLRYLIVDTGFWIFGKKVLLPIGRINVDYNDKKIYVQGLTKQQVENLPNFDDLEKVDYDYEEQVRSIYRPTAATSGMTQETTAYDRDTYNYSLEPSLYDIDEQNNQSLKLYEERLVANKQRHKAGEVSISKHVETETARVAVPVEKERVVIERTNPTSTTSSNPKDAFREGEVARMEIYEETPDIRKEAVVREEVRVKKIVDRDTVEAQEKVRREELDIDTDGRPIEHKQL
ncbi:DUF2382 domain-containing protein [Scytonema sp. UIC 10036]|uniref:DUF2382 domain-containing protein n=1 Tax=Scytonema sp. UIC 10036 TaxID=2304196 RepID=UPI0012DA564C|nr:DUF2382 domain-containing protein [Scytonema sp. UIC 10036]MUG91399.1 DUF2382 domain-containing protein [Scytonema sp. UIC 10036]